MNSRMLERFREYINTTQFNAVRLGLASSEKIRSLSYGEVKKIETINYRTLKPEKDGLFCARIFGPQKDWECNCGKYKRMKHRGVTCEKCGVEVIQSRVRRERMGHIELVAPVCHIWYLKGIPSYLGLCFDVAVKDLERVIYFDAAMVIHQGNSPYARKTVLSNQEHQQYCDSHPDDIDFVAKSGAEAIREILKLIDIQLEVANLQKDYEKTSSVAIRHKIMRRIKVLTGFLNGSLRPEWMVLDILPVLPPDLRPLVPLEGGRFASSDLNELYRRVLNRNIRLRRLMEIEAPSVIIKNEMRMLQESVDALIDNGRRGQPVRGTNKRPLKSLSEMLRGKQGRFRQNLLGRRVDYSGRSVIVVDPELHMNQCGLPKAMALELFKPYVYAGLLEQELAPNLRVAKKMVEELLPEVWDVLEDVVQDKIVLLNRPPTLHRLGIQGFNPILVDGKAIKIHPLVCSAFNADFDGDQMAVHLPLSKVSQKESKKLILSTQNILSPANGKPTTVPDQDMVLGLHYITKVRCNVLGEGTAFSNVAEAIRAFQHEQVHLHAQVQLRLSGDAIVDTTMGRILFFDALPQGAEFQWINKVVNKGDIRRLVERIYYRFGADEAVVALDKIKKLGFYYSTMSGISFPISDLITPENKDSIISKAEKAVRKVEQMYMDGVITNGERHNKVISIWGHATADVASDMTAHLDAQNQESYQNKNKKSEPFNSIFMMLDSGARGSKDQIKQLVGMRGLMAKPSGEIMETPVRKNFKDGLSVFEYFTSTHGARKGQADTALKTANSGYLTRRLVDVTQDVVVTMEDCKTLGYMRISDLQESGNVIYSLADRVYGRVLAADVKDSVSDALVLPQGAVITRKDVTRLKHASVSEVFVRSVLTCQARRGVCSRCYGCDLSKGGLADVGATVGIIAAQSIGEPGTQLTMRTFHIGGTASGLGEQSFFASRHNGVVKLEGIRTVKNKDGQSVVMSRRGHVVVASADGRELQRHEVEYGSFVFVQNGTVVAKGDKLAEWDVNSKVILTEKTGTVRFVDLIDNVTLQEQFDEATNRSTKMVVEHKGEKYQPAIAVIGDQGEELAHYYLPTGALLSVADGQAIHVGDAVVKMPREQSKTKDITGGLPRIAELFEARLPKDPAIMADIDGTVVFGGLHRGMRKISIVAGEQSFDYFVPRGQQINVVDGEQVKAGDPLTSGTPVLHDILRILGPDTLQRYLVDQVQEIYRLQGVDINDRHIELIVRQMLRKVKIADSGDTDFLVGDKVDRIHLKTVNELLRKEGKKVAQARPVLMGITMASLDTESFLSAASFQETTRILAESAIAGQVDHLYGLKENIIIGKLIPAGTGIPSFKEKYLGQDVSDLERQAREVELAVKGEASTSIQEDQSKGA